MSFDNCVTCVKREHIRKMTQKWLSVFLSLNFSENVLLFLPTFEHISVHSSPDIFKTHSLLLVSMHLRGITLIWHHCAPPSQHNETDGSETKRKDVKGQKTTDWNEEKRCVSVSYLQIFLQSQFVASQDALSTQNVVIWLVCSRPAQMNPPDSTFDLN